MSIPSWLSTKPNSVQPKEINDYSLKQHLLPKLLQEICTNKYLQDVIYKNGLYFHHPYIYTYKERRLYIYYIKGLGVASDEGASIGTNKAITNYLIGLYSTDNDTVSTIMLAIPKTYFDEGNDDILLEYKFSLLNYPWETIFIESRIEQFLKDTYPMFSINYNKNMVDKCKNNTRIEESRGLKRETYTSLHIDIHKNILLGHIIRLIHDNTDLRNILQYFKTLNRGLFFNTTDIYKTYKLRRRYRIQNMYIFN